MIILTHTRRRRLAGIHPDIYVVKEGERVPVY
jgi:hypothetical protein